MSTFDFSTLFNPTYGTSEGFRVVSGSVRKPNLPGLDLRRLLFLKLTPMVRFPNRTGYNQKQ